MNRRDVLKSLLPAAASSRVAAGYQARPGSLKITDLRITRVHGRREMQTGGKSEMFVQPLHTYPEYRPRLDAPPPPVETSVKPVSMQYLHIVTDAGLEGVYGPVDWEASVYILQRFKKFLIGKDPLAGSVIWDQMFREFYLSRVGNPVMIAMATVDNALWDLRGRYFGVPVHRLLGGPSRATVDVYATSMLFSQEPEALRARALQTKQMGFRGQKWFMTYGPSDGLSGLNKNVDLVRRLREIVGDSHEIMFDAVMGWDLNYALAWADRVKDFRPSWIEEPFPPHQIESFAQLRRATPIPVATGERFHSRSQALDYLKAGAVSIMQCDPEWTGGVTESSRICSLCELFDVPFIPHGHNDLAALHIAASQAPAVVPMFEYPLGALSSRHYFEKDPPRVIEGKVAVPSTPGFGITLDDAKIERREQLT